MTDLKISPLPTFEEAFCEWEVNLKWSLTGDCWCHDGTHATNIPLKTKSLSNDLLSVCEKAVTEHTSTSHQHNAHSLFQDHINGVNGIDLITQSKGFEMYQCQIKSGFSPGLGTEAISSLTEYVSVIHQNLESIGTFFDRKLQLYEQVQVTKSCNIGPTAQKSFTLEGLWQGAYHKVLGGPWVKKILIRQGRLKLEMASMTDLQHGATDLLATSTYFKNNALMPGKLSHPRAPSAAWPLTLPPLAEVIPLDPPPGRATVPAPAPRSSSLSNNFAWAFL
jgi:hypothetical protein